MFQRRKVSSMETQGNHKHLSLILLENDGCGGAPSMLFKYEYEDNLIAEGAIAIPNDAQSYNYDEEKGTVLYPYDVIETIDKGKLVK